MKYVSTIHTSTPERLTRVQAGQWISYDGSRGRFMGRRNGTVWIAWSTTATKRFPLFAAAYRSA